MVNLSPKMWCTSTRNNETINDIKILIIILILIIDLILNLILTTKTTKAKLKTVLLVT